MSNFPDTQRDESTIESPSMTQESLTPNAGATPVGAPSGPPVMTKAAASFFCGMFSMVLCWCGGVPSILLGGVAIWLGIWVRKNYRGNTASEMANVLSWVGTIVGGIGIILGLISVLFWLLTGSASIFGAMK